MSAIEKELCKATKVKRKEGEKTQEYFKRLVKKVQELDDEGWEALSSKAQKWINACARAINDDEKLPNFPDAGGDDDEDEAPAKSKKSKKVKDEDEDEEEEDEEEEEAPKSKKKKPAKDEDEDEDEEEEEAPKSKKKKARRSADDDDGEDAEDEDEDEDEDKMAKKAKKAKAAKAAGKTKEKKPRGSGAQAAIKTAVIKNPKATAEQITAILEKKGMECSESSVTSIRAGTLQTLRLVKELGMPKGDF